MEMFAIDIDAGKTAVIENDSIEYVNVHGTIVVNGKNQIHFLTLHEGSEAQVNSLRCIDHMAVLNGARAVLNTFDGWCNIQLHIGGEIVNATDMDTEELAQHIEMYDDFHTKVVPHIEDNKITGTKQEDENA